MILPVALLELVASILLVMSLRNRQNHLAEPSVTTAGRPTESIKHNYTSSEYVQFQYDIRKSKRAEQCKTFTIDDMLQFPEIPIAWSYIPRLNYTFGIAWAMLNWNNQRIVLDYISQVNEIIVDSHEYIPGTEDAFIDLDDIDFDYPKPMRITSMCRTRLECFPYTPKGKLSKYPVIIHFETGRNGNPLYTIGEIKILQDGSIGDATVSINSNRYKIGLHGRSLVLKRVDNRHAGNIFNFNQYISQ